MNYDFETLLNNVQYWTCIPNIVNNWMFFLFHNQFYMSMIYLVENRSRSLSPHHAHRRSFSNDTSNLLQSGNDCYSTHNGRSEETHPSGTRDSYSTGTPY